MPTNRRLRPIERKRSRFRELNKCWLVELKTGKPWFPQSGSDGDTEALREAWEACRDELLPKCIAEKPGHRPFAWWLFDHGKERPTNPKWPNSETMKNIGRQHGFLHTSILMGWKETRITFQESEPEYLRRHGLLTEAELNYLDRQTET